MNTNELLRQDPKVIVVDKYSGAEFTVGELTPIVAEMRLSSLSEADRFCDRFKLKERGDVAVCDEESAAEFLHGLADRIFKIPVMYGTGQCDVDRLRDIAWKLNSCGKETE